MYGRSRVNVKVEHHSTFTFTRGLSYMASFSFTRVNFTCVLTEKLRDSGNQPLETTLNEEMCLIGFEQNILQFCMLQEVHCTENTNQLWSAEWGYQTVFSSFESIKAGVCRLFNNNFNLQIPKLFIDPLGRFIICDIKANEQILTLANIYAPNDDNQLSF